MASSGKKGKKKGTVISLQSFLANGDVPAGTTQVTKKVRSLDGDESDDGTNVMPLVFQLPTAPRANRIFDDDAVPQKPPHIAYLTNLPFDTKEEDLNDFFGSMPIVSLRLPREEGETGRVRGFGYVEFESREDLINALSMPDPCVKGRRIRIELSNESEHQGLRQRGNRRGFEGFNNSGENRDSTNWRRENHMNEYSDNYDRNLNRERKYESDDKTALGSWRSGHRSLTNSHSHRSDQNVSSKSKINDSDRILTNNLKKDDLKLERPKLNLKPRTLPLPSVANFQESEACVATYSENKSLFKLSGVPSQKVFGSAKPVDTATRELEIEERMSEARHQEQLKQDLDQSIVNEKIGGIQLEKTNKENTNYTASWRRKNDSIQYQQNQERLEAQKNDNRRFERDAGCHIKPRDSNERMDKTKFPQHDGKQKDENKIKRFTKNERILPIYQENLNTPVLQTSNKYSGLDDEASD